MKKKRNDFVANPIDIMIIYISVKSRLQIQYKTDNCSGFSIIIKLKSF